MLEGLSSSRGPGVTGLVEKHGTWALSYIVGVILKGPKYHTLSFLQPGIPFKSHVESQTLSPGSYCGLSLQFFFCFKFYG